MTPYETTSIEKEQYVYVDRKAVRFNEFQAKRTQIINNEKYYMISKNMLTTII